MSAKTYTLENGVTVVIDPMPNVETMSAGFYFKVGSRHEDESDNGVAHFLEHMAFKGTPTRTARDINRGFGMLGASSDAFTGQEATCFHARGMAIHSSEILEILGDMSLNSTFPEHEIEIERSVIIEEIVGSDEDDYSFCADNAYAMAFPEQPLGRPVAGRVGNVEKMDIPTLIRFRDEHYHAGNLIVSVAGNVETDKVLKQVEELTKGLRRGGESRYEPACYEGGDGHEKSQGSQLSLTVLFNSSSANNSKELAAEMVLSSILGGDMWSRLYQTTREECGLVYSIDAAIEPMRDTGVFAISADIGSEKAGKLISLLAEELKNISLKNVSDDEITMARNAEAYGIAKMMESPGARMIQNATYTHHRGYIPSPRQIMDEINAVTADDVRVAAQRIFSSKPVLSTVGSGERKANYYQTLQNHLQLT